MDSDKRMPPDVENAQDRIEDAAEGVADRAADFASRAVDEVKDRYDRTKAKLAEIDPAESLRDAGRYVQEAGEAAVDTVERHPLAAFALGAASVGLIAWAITGRRASSEWTTLPDTGRFTRLLRDYGEEALQTGRSLLGSGREQLDNSRDYLSRGRDYIDAGRDYAREGGRLLVKRSQREPLAAAVGVGLALYAVASLLGSGSAKAQPARRRTKR
ncbi:hypothetical protein ABE438_05575 [Bosea sp. TWI1241]|uniref:hypothetical protein n=1 Tax=Bosea sp. TWI1241 TaxID=3148904 RepID=UPI003207D3CB